MVYKVDSTGHETVLYSFTGGADGGKPYGGLVSDAGGNLYGTTYGGGTNSGGVVFEIAPQFTIAGQVASDGTALAGVTMTLSGSATGSAITDNNGNYGLAAAPGRLPVTPSMVGFTFSPASISFTGLSANQTANFAASALNYTISGQILGPGGTGLGGVGVQAAAYTNGTVTDSGGNYSLSVPAFGDYTVTPNRTGYYFSPGSVAFNDLSGNQTVNFLGTSTDASDFNHGGNADVVWQDPTTGAAQIWYLADITA